MKAAIADGRRRLDRLRSRIASSPAGARYPFARAGRRLRSIRLARGEARRPGAPPTRPVTWLVLERALLAVAAVCLGYYGYVSLQASLYQAYENRELDAILRSARVVEAAAPDGTARARPPLEDGTVIGRIEIPRLRVTAIVRTGSDARTLQLAVGHIPGTAHPGDSGNVGLAGHRDTFFRRLEDIRPDDEIRLVTPEGTFRYRVQRTDVVAPSDVWVLDPTDTPVLTLVTCYPFTYVGSAPERFVVRAGLERPATPARAG